MNAYPTPPDEADRLRAVQRYEILDSGREPGFDRITQMASKIFDVPIALVSIIGSDRQWFKSACGLDTSETPRSHAFCAHTIARGSTLVVEDATADARFQDNPLVTGHPHIRFYAGAPLITDDGHGLGSLCIIDDKPRTIDASDLELLESLAEMVMDEMDLRLALQEARRIEGERTELIGMVTHEVRNPLTGALGFAQLLAGKADLGDEERDMAERIRDAIADADSIISDLLTLTRMDRDRFDVEVRVVNVGSELTAVLDSLERAPSCRVHVDDSVNVDVMADPLRLRQILRNLISNAVRYGGDLIEIRTSDAGETILIDVCDNGDGVEDEHADTLFQPFARGSDGRHNPDSSGLGLAVSRRMAHAMGGELAHRRCDGLTCFELSLRKSDRSMSHRIASVGANSAR